MKQKGSHPEKSLSAVKIRSLKQPGRYADGNGLYLVVDASGAKRWLLRIVVLGKRRDVGLGSTKLVSLAEARETAQQFRKKARAGDDPVAERRNDRLIVPTFAQASARVHAEHAPAWRNAKHAAQWINTLTEYAFPHIGAMTVDRVESREILQVLSPIWLEKPETARRVKQRIGTVLDWAIAAGFRTAGNPVGSVAKGLPRHSDRKKHHSALPFKEVPGFVQALRAHEGLSEQTKLAFELLILTATRTSELLNATWPEFDREGKVWTIPAGRMKAGLLHRVPLGDRACTIVARARELGAGSNYLFPGRSGTRPLSNMVFLMALRRINLTITAHGFRSAFRDWAAEQTSYPRDVCEMALAHTVRDKTEAAYRRGDLFEKRRELMRAWESYLNQATGDVIVFRGRGT
jgi:integrase